MSLIKKLVISLAVALPSGALLSFCMPGDFWIGLAGAGLLLAVSIFLLLSAWQWAGGTKLLAWMVALAFILRLGVGVMMTLELPTWGFANSVELQHGYLFTDSFKRDQQSWDLAVSTQPLWAGVTEGFYADQYGGLLALSAALYRTLSPDTHRQILVLILGALFSALGIPFLYQAVRLRWSERTAALAAWLVVLYPDSVLFGASQMREPFITGLMCIAFWGFLIWKVNRRQALIALISSLVLMVFFSSLITLSLLGFLAVLFWAEYVAPVSKTWKRLGQVTLGVGVLIGLFLFWRWMSSASTWDIIVTMLGSGWVSKLVKDAGSLFRIPIVVVYGIAQPVLPAALVAINTRPVMYVIAVLRAAGWYLLAPLMVYGIFTLWTRKDIKERRLLVWVSIFSLLWITISAIRAGGDQWDNPRYRVNFILWLALLAAWGVEWAWQKRDFWLARWILVEFIFIGFFAHWYIGRYFRLWERMYFQNYVIWILALSALVLASGWLWDFLNKSFHIKLKS
jgi:hypothetical protein